MGIGDWGLGIGDWGLGVFNLIIFSSIVLFKFIIPFLLKFITFIIRYYDIKKII